MTKIRRRPISDNFSIAKEQEKLVVNPDNTGALEMIDYYMSHAENKALREEDSQWQKNNLEYDLRSTDWIAEKCKDEAYAQNLYAALCNNQFIKNDVWPLLKDDLWSCSWRYAGGIIADIREEGDYIDWYCSGIRDKYDAEANTFGRCYVSESVVTDEIRQDLFTLGWLVRPYPDEE